MFLNWEKELHMITLESSYLLCPTNIIAQHHGCMWSVVFNYGPEPKVAVEMKLISMDMTIEMLY